MDDTPISLLSRVCNPTDSGAWREFDAIYRPMLRRYASSCGLDVHDVDDVVQSCLATIHQRIVDFSHDRKVGRFRAWLRTMVINRVRNQIAKRRPQEATTQDLQGEQQRELLPEQQFDRIWWNEHLRFYLAQIQSVVDQKSYLAFESYVIEQIDAADVCRRFDLTRQQLYKLKWQMTQRLRHKMAGLLDES